MANPQWLRDNAAKLNIANASSLEEFADDYEQLQTELVCANEMCGGYKAELAKAKAEYKECDTRNAELHEANEKCFAENERLKKALNKYGVHPPYCQIQRLIGHKPELGCTCGLAKALKENKL